MLKYKSEQMLQGGRNGVVSENEMRPSGFDSQHLIAPFARIFYRMILNSLLCHNSKKLK
jgi:hypothetical protein